MMSLNNILLYFMLYFKLMSIRYMNNLYRMSSFYNFGKHLHFEYSKRLNFSFYSQRLYFKSLII